MRRNNYLDAEKNKNSKFWSKIQQKKTLALFRSMASRVPAYKDFLKLNKINPAKIKSYKCLNLVPPINKKNYISRYHLKDLCWDGEINRTYVLTSTSGSTGDPSYFLRDEKLDWQYSIEVGKYLRQSKISGNTLVIICFGMGIWIGGLITYKAFEIAGREAKLPISIITPGINKKEIFSALKRLAPNYNQTILVGYSPLIKDIIDLSTDQGIDLKKTNVRYLFAAEAIPEEVRDYLARKSGVNSIYRDFINVYGSADIGAMAYESALSILIKRRAMSIPGLFQKIFSPIEKIPTLAQYNPYFINFQTLNANEIILSGDSAIPLMRYSIGDNGGVYTYEDLSDRLKRNGVDISEEINKADIHDIACEFPFVYVYERADFSTNLYGINIFPEWLRRAIISSELSRYLTGKFTMITKYDESNSQYLEVNLEKKKNVKIPLALIKKSTRILVKSMIQSSSEYRELISHLREKAHPKLVFWEAEDPKYFQPGIKQKWVQKNI